MIDSELNQYELLQQYVDKPQTTMNKSRLSHPFKNHYFDQVRLETESKEWLLDAESFLNQSIKTPLDSMITN